MSLFGYLHHVLPQRCSLPTGRGSQLSRIDGKRYANTTLTNNKGNARSIPAVSMGRSSKVVWSGPQRGRISYKCRQIDIVFHAKSLIIQGRLVPFVSFAPLHPEWACSFFPHALPTRRVFGIGFH